MTTQNKQSTFAEVDGRISDACLNVSSTVKERIMSRTKMTTQTEAMRKFNPTEAKPEEKKRDPYSILWRQAMLLTAESVHTQIFLNNAHKFHLRGSSWKMIL